MNTKICPVCQNPIPANAPGGLCPACVLRDADEPAPAGRAAPALAATAAARADQAVSFLAQSLARVGFAAFFKILAPAQPPEKPWMAEDEPPFSPAQP